MPFQENEPRVYAYFLSDGSVRVQTTENDPKAVRREYETKDGKSGVKFERKYRSVSGMLVGLKFRDDEYGTTLSLVLRAPGEDDIVLSVNAGSAFHDDLLKKLPNVDVSQPVIFAPYAFTDSTGKERRGVTVMQDDEKLSNFFYDPATKESLHDFPRPDGDTKTYSKDDWKIYFLRVRKFLRSYTEANITPKLTDNAVASFGREVAQEVLPQGDLGKADEIDTSNIPF